MPFKIEYLLPVLAAGPQLLKFLVCIWKNGKDSVLGRIMGRTDEWFSRREFKGNCGICQFIALQTVVSQVILRRMVRKTAEKNLSLSV